VTLQDLKEKQALRLAIQKIRDLIPSEERKVKTQIIAEKFYSLREYCEAANVLIYYPFRSEIDTTVIIVKALTDGKRVILPRVSGKVLELFYVRDIKKDLKPGTFGIIEPCSDSCDPAKYTDPDIVVVPGVGFDRQKNRLGYGGGFYDRLLPKLSKNIQKIALCFQVQIIDSIPSFAHDVRVDKVISEYESF
jgi:5-formyltetrahydrofolate cyclo-ligase